MQALAPDRPQTYRRPGAWQLALRRLWERGYSDPEIAELLSDLSPEAINDLERRRRWNWRAVERACVPESGGRRFTARQVEYHRRKLCRPCPQCKGTGGSASWSCVLCKSSGNSSEPEMPGHPNQAELPALAMARQRDYQLKAGWGHLLPRYDEDLQEWRPGFELRKREADLLSALRDLGPLTRAHLCRALAVTSLNTAGRSYLVRLQLAGLVRCAWQGRAPGVYRLAGRAAEYPLTGRADAADGLTRLAVACGACLA